MKQCTLLLSLLVPALMLAGCTDTATDSAGTAGSLTTDDLGHPDDGMVTGDVEEVVSDVDWSAGTTTELTAVNTTISFVGTHIVEEKPDPKARNGHFDSFTGKALVKDGALTALTVDIDTPSVTTDQDKLTNHLKSADFFDVNEHPKASFNSTSIEANGDEVTITGELTLLGTTKEISFPAEVSTEGGLTLDAEFTIDRTAFGMNYGLDSVEKLVTMTVTIGK